MCLTVVSRGVHHIVECFASPIKISVLSKLRELTSYKARARAVSYTQLEIIHYSITSCDSSFQCQL